ncbi:hypothetical protein ZWY2020_012331 [Hordeum vulgare]|nr:hypothetical protein ZWY2020_012331 [Hordeum vulgare]
MVLASLLLLLVLATTAHGIRLDRHLHEALENKQEQLAGQPPKPNGAADSTGSKPCTADGNCPDTHKKKDDGDAQVTSQGAEQEEAAQPQQKKWSRRTLPRRPHQPQQETRTYPDLIDIAGMDYSPAARSLHPQLNRSRWIHCHGVRRLLYGAATVPFIHHACMHGRWLDLARVAVVRAPDAPSLSGEARARPGLDTGGQAASMHMGVLHAPAARSHHAPAAWAAEMAIGVGYGVGEISARTTRRSHACMAPALHRRWSRWNDG